MSDGKVCKVARYQLQFLYNDKNDYCYPYDELPMLQQLVSRAKNRTVQACWEWHNFQVAFRQEHGVLPDGKTYMDGMTLSGYVNKCLKSKFYPMYSQNLTCAVRSAIKAFNSAKPKIEIGERSVLSYRADAPIEIHNERIHIIQDKQRYYAELNLFSSKYVKEKSYGGTALKFELYRVGGSQRSIIERCMTGEYKIGKSEMIYSKKKHCWFLNLTYSFTPQNRPQLNPEKIMGVDLGINCVAYMGFGFCEDRFFIGRSEVEAFRKKIEARRRTLQQQGKYCGDGRIGHGYNTRVQPSLKLSDAIKRFRDTANHKYSRYIVQKAVEFGCGTIQMEDLSGINAASDKFLKDWTYFDLRQKIEYKAKECGITLKLVNPRYTSQRCSKCGHIDKENRPKEKMGQAFFQCTQCGYNANADYNASVNIATPDIEKIISNQLRAKSKQT